MGEKRGWINEREEKVDDANNGRYEITRGFYIFLIFKDWVLIPKATTDLCPVAVSCLPRKHFEFDVVTPIWITCSDRSHPYFEVTLDKSLMTKCS